MPDYQLSKIYAIRGGDEVYIGSSAQKYLSSRYVGHKSHYKCFKAGKVDLMCTVFILFDKYGIENCFIELIESFPCKSVEELRKKEGEHIRNTKNCVNRRVEGRDEKKSYEANKEYYEANKDKILENQKQYRGTKKEELKEYYKEYYEENKQKILEQRKVLLEQRKVLYTCECGSELRLQYKTRHERSKKHTAFINQNTITE